MNDQILEILENEIEQDLKKADKPKTVFVKNNNTYEPLCHTCVLFSSSWYHRVRVKTMFHAFSSVLLWLWDFNWPLYLLQLVYISQINLYRYESLLLRLFFFRFRLYLNLFSDLSSPVCLCRRRERTFIEYLHWLSSMGVNQCDVC